MRKQVVAVLLLWVVALCAQAAVCTVNVGLIEPPNPDIDLNGVAGVPGLVIGVGEPTCDFAPNPCNDNLGVVYVNGVAATLPANTAQLNAVSVASASYAVAVGDEKFGSTPLVQFNGTSWTAMPTTGTEPTDDANGVKTYGPTQTYVVGDQGIYFFNGTTWTRQLQTGSVPSVNGQNADKFEAIWGDADTVYALADNGALYRKAATATPTTWTRITAAYPAGANKADFKGIAGDAAGNVYVTGQTDNNKGFVYRYSPSTNTWTDLLTTTGSFDMNAIAVNPVTGSITAVGDNGAQLVSSANGAAPWTQTTPVNNVNDINGVFIDAAGNTYLAGQTEQGCTSTTPRPVVEYRLDETSSGAVVDSGVNALDGAANGGLTLGGAGKVCGSYKFNGSNAYVSVPHNALLNLSQVTAMSWVRHSNVTIKNWEAIVTKGDSAYRVHHNGACSINGVNTAGGLDFGVNSGCGTADINSGTVPVAGTWYHLAGTYDGTTIKVYVNGALSASSAYSGALASNTLALMIGENAQQRGRYFNGDIDEVKIYSSALTAAQISAGYANENAGKNWDGSARVCSVSGPDHLEIQHPSGNGLTCAASTLTIRACADAACTTLYTGGVSGTLTATGTPTVNWDGSTDGATGAGFVIAAGSSSVTKNLQVASSGSVVFGIATPTPAPVSAASCNFGAPACTFTANSSGFVFSDTSTGTAYTIPAQVSGIASTGLYLRALQSATTNPAVCTPAIIGQTTAVTVGYACNNPASCQPGNLARVNTTAIAAGGTAVDLTFDSNGSAPVVLRYDDVGQITVQASKTVTPFGASTPVTLTGSSNALVVAPHHFGFSNVTVGPITAGRNFSATVAAYNGLSTPAVTANFGQEVAPEGVTLSFNKYQPVGAGAVNGVFSGSAGAFAAGAATATNLNWSEVGSIDLAAVLASGSYLGSGLSASGVSGSTGLVGPFIPDHFDVVVPQGCVSGAFTYSGQTIGPTVTAMNGATPPARTLNYDGSAATSPNFARAFTLSDANGLALGSFSPSVLAASAFLAGVAAPTTAYAFSSALTAPATIAVRAVATDGVSSSGFAEGTLAVRTGRLRLQNTFGSEKLALSVPIQAQFWNGSYFVNNDLDSCTTLAVPAVQTLATGASPNGAAALYFYPVVANKNQLLGSDTTPSLVSPLTGGKTLLLFTAPQKRGWLDVVLQVPDYLQGNWGNCSGQTGAAGLYDDLPCARATFGVFGAGSPLIYRRENY